MTFLRMASAAPNTPAYCSASNLQTGWGGGNGNYATCQLQGQTQVGLVFFANATTIVAPSTGMYVIQFAGHANVQNNNQGVGARMLRQGNPSVGQSLGNTVCVVQPDRGLGSGPGADMGFACMVFLNIGESIQFQGYQSWGTTFASMWMAFAPTPSFRR